MKILQVIAGLHKIGGTTTFVGGLANALAAQGDEVTVATYRERNPDDEYPLDDRVRVLPIPEIERSGTRFDVVHVHGLWDRDVFWASGYALKNKIPLVWSPHGMLAPWALKHRWWKKLLPWHLYLKKRLQKASAIHVTAELEKTWVEGLGLGPVVVAPLGTGELAVSGRWLVAGGERKVEDGEIEVLFVGRVHPVKGLMNLVRAAARVKTKKTVRFRIVGADDGGFLEELRRECLHYEITEMFDFAGPKFGSELSAEYDNCDVLILPSFTENFGGVVVDALAHGKPVIASTNTPWKELVEHHCGWWVDNSPINLAKAIDRMAETPREELLKMGENGRKLVAAKYTWDAVAAQMHKCYNTLV